MKKRNIIISIIAFLALKIIYLISINHWMGIEPNKKFFIYAPVFFLLGMIYFSINLWRNTTNEFIDALSDVEINNAYHIFTSLVLIMSGSKYYKDYHLLPIFESNIALFVGIGAIDAFATVIFFNMLFKNFALSMYRARD